VSTHAVAIDSEHTATISLHSSNWNSPSKSYHIYFQHHQYEGRCSVLNLSKRNHVCCVFMYSQFIRNKECISSYALTDWT